MEHAELISEMPHIEQMVTAERLVLAKRRRTHQLKTWQQREKEHEKKTSKMAKSNKRGIKFMDSVVLLEAAARNDIDEVRKLLMRGVNPDSGNEDGLTALHQCCIDNNESMLLLLLEYGANANAEDSEKWTPLHAAATCGHLKLVRILISRGANLLAVNADGNMPYDICEDEQALDYIESEMSKRGVTQELIDETRAHTEKRMLYELQRMSRRELEKHDSQGATPLHIASANGYLSVVDFLLENNVNTDVKDRDDWRPAHAAACWGHIDVLERLVQSGADLMAKNKHDETPADICEDPELKRRIAELRVEQENRRLLDSHKKVKVKRSQSNNTRTQSVRRTSLRDKGLTARRDAAEEGRFRLEQIVNPGLNENNNQPQLVEQNGSTNHQQPPQSVLDSPKATESNAIVPIAATERRAPDGRDDDAVTNNHLVETSPKNETSYSTTDVNGKVTVVHVVVTINGNGTLADLKKQRMQIRNSTSDVTSLSSQVGTNDVVESVPMSGTSSSRTANDIMKFTTKEVVGAEKPRKCCVIQ